MFNLRPYQTECLNETLARIQSKQKYILNVLPTAAGKTVIFSYLAERLYKNYKVIITVPRNILINQTREKIQAICPMASVTAYNAGINEKDMSGDIVITSIQSLFRIDQDLQTSVVMGKEIIFIFDEVHEANTEGLLPKKQSREGTKTRELDDWIEEKQPSKEGMHTKVIKMFRPSCVIGFTATPMKKTTTIFGKDKLWPKVDFYRDMRFMIDNGYLCNYSFKQVESSEECHVEELAIKGGDYDQVELNKMQLGKAEGQVKDALKRLHGRKKVVWACCSIDHAERILQILRQSGEKAVILHSKMKSMEVLGSKDEFEAGDCRHAISVIMLSVGYDYPAIDAIVCLRPTRSISLYIQLLGRGLRLLEGKTNCLFLDYGKIIKTLGFPDSIDFSKEQNRKSSKQVMLKVCKECGEMCPWGTKACPSCGHEFVKKKIVQQVEKKLTDKAYDDSVIDRANIVLGMKVERHLAMSGNVMIKAVFELDTGKSVIEYLKFEGSGKSYAEKKWKIMTQTSANIPRTHNDAMKRLHEIKKPYSITIEKDGMYNKITNYIFETT
jgi:DNA repair protein RadD